MRYFYYFCRHSLVYQATFYFLTFQPLMGILTMKLLLLTIISLCFFSVKAQNFRLITDVQQHQLNGKVKNVKEIIEYEAPFFSAIDTVFYSFSKDGFITKSETRTLQGEPINEAFKTIFERQGSVATTIVYNQEGKEIDGNVVKLNKKGFPIEMEMQLNDTEKVKVYYHYDPKDSKLTLVADDKIINVKQLITYNKEGFPMIKEVFKDDDPLPITKNVYTYNSRGFATTVLSQNADKKETKITYEYQYDTHGSAIEIKKYENGKLKSTAKRTIEYY